MTPRRDPFTRQARRTLAIAPELARLNGEASATHIQVLAASLQEDPEFWSEVLRELGADVAALRAVIPDAMRPDPPAQPPKNLRSIAASKELQNVWWAAGNEAARIGLPITVTTAAVALGMLQADEASGELAELLMKAGIEPARLEATIRNR
jgi:ATP-dependent Clp protease ATP-binding subunit ClpA